MGVIIQNFIGGIVFCFLGFLPSGLITLSIVDLTINKGKKAAIKFSFGALIPLFITTFFTLQFYSYLNSSEYLIIIDFFSCLIFLLFSVYFFITKPKSRGNYNYTSDFFNGIIVSSMNALIIPFWLFLIPFFEKTGVKINDLLQVFSLSIGALVGALTTFCIYIYFANRVSASLNPSPEKFRKFLSIIFFLLFIWTLLKKEILILF